MPNVKLYKGDCLLEMDKIPDGSVDLILADPPYGTTACKWDNVIPFGPMWAHIWRVLKPNGACVLFGSEPFSSLLITSELAFFKYSLIWEKTKVSHFAQAPYRFLSIFENLLIFSKGGCSKNAKNKMIYNPQGVNDCEKICKGKAHSDHRPSSTVQKDYVQKKTNYPKNILKFKSDNAKEHPTQKPVALLEYLIKTYTNENETVLDFTMGSGSTGVACVNTNRNFIGIEMDDKYFEIAEKRINQTCPT
ncbi:MAG: site-specific DNA-methyltransferase [Nostocales cyanobacterium 94392]|nr:site-specific DNA-methyltransferase [Nostocales cyanobacterium 94392]